MNPTSSMLSDVLDYVNNPSGYSTGFFVWEIYTRCTYK